MPMFMFCCHNVNGCSIAGMFEFDVGTLGLSVNPALHRRASRTCCNARCTDT